jgi:hypothetical protein
MKLFDAVCNFLQLPGMPEMNWSDGRLVELDWNDSMQSRGEWTILQSKNGQYYITYTSCSQRAKNLEFNVLG